MDHYLSRKRALDKKAIKIYAGLAIMFAAAAIRPTINGLGMYFSPAVPESQVREFVDDIAREHNFHDSIEVNIVDHRLPVSVAKARYDKDRDVNVITVARHDLKELVLRHEAKHIVDGHVKDNPKDPVKRFTNEWSATLYSLGLGRP